MKTVTGPTENIVIVGAGLGGLSAALRLAGAGRTVTVIEREAVPGGRNGLLTDSGFAFDTGPTVLTMPDLIADALDGHERLRVHAELLAGGLHARRRDGPERRDAVGDERELHFFAGLGGRLSGPAGLRRGRGFSGLVARSEAEQQRGHGGEGQG